MNWTIVHSKADFEYVRNHITGSNDWKLLDSEYNTPNTFVH